VLQWFSGFSTFAEIPGISAVWQSWHTNGNPYFSVPGRRIDVADFVTTV
jgi:hypothetical protein